MNLKEEKKEAMLFQEGCKSAENYHNLNLRTTNFMHQLNFYI